MAPPSPQQTGRPACHVPRGDRGSVAAASPLAVAAGLSMLEGGGNAIDAAIAASAVLTVVAPEACGVGGDGLFLLRRADGTREAMHGAGVWPVGSTTWSTDGGASVAVPGLVDAWCQMTRRGALPLAACLEPAIDHAISGHAVAANVVEAATEQADRLDAGGAADWVMRGLEPGQTVRQDALGELLLAVATRGRSAFYEGTLAAAMAATTRRAGGHLDVTDLAAHRGAVREPLDGGWVLGRHLHVQPAPSQGVLLAMSARAVEDLVTALPADELARLGFDHVAIEATNAAFVVRDDAALGSALLEHPIAVTDRAVDHGPGPRAYLHTAGVATADRDGNVVSGLVSVFDDFGSGVFVDEGGFVLNNRAGGFTAGANAPRPGSHPVHTLAPALIERDGEVMALATPGADGQVQTLLQVLMRLHRGTSLGDAVSAPRWRSQDRSLLIEAGHEAAGALEDRGHRLAGRPAGDPLFGAVVSAGIDSTGPYACADWRRATAAGAT